MKKIWYDKDQAEAIYNWVIHGLQPGGCSWCIIMGDFEGAEARAHPHLKNHPSFTFREMFENLQNIVPNCLKGHSTHKGLRDMSEDELAMMEFDVAMCDDISARYLKAINHERDLRKLHRGMAEMKKNLEKKNDLPK